MKILFVLLILFPVASYATNYQIGVGATERTGTIFMFSVEPDTNSSIVPRLDFGSINNAGKFHGFTDENFKFIGISAFWRGNRFEFGFGAIELNHQTQFLTSKYQFMTTLGFRITPRTQIEFRHISNGNTAGANFGDNLITLSLNF